MQSLVYNVLLLFLLLLSIPVAAQPDILQFRSDVVDSIFGRAVPDPYRWMENLGSDSVKQWLAKQQSITKAERQKFKGRLTIARNDIDEHSYTFTPNAQKVGSWYFYVASARYTAPQPVLYYRETYYDRLQVAYDPNEPNLNVNYTFEGIALSDSNRYLAVTLSPSNSDWREIRVRDMIKKKDLKDRIYWVKYSDVVWWKDGFFYSRYKKPRENFGQEEKLSGEELYYHKLGDSQTDDRLVLASAGDAHSSIKFQKTSNKRYLVINFQQKIKGEWYDMLACKDLEQGLYADLKLIAKSPVSDKTTYKVIDFIGSAFFILSNYKALHYRVLRCPPDSINHFTEVIPAYDRVLQRVSHLNHELVAIYFTGGKYEVYMFNYQGKMISGLNFEEGIAVYGFNGQPGDTDVMFYENTFYMPSVTYRYSFNSRKSSLYNQIQVEYRPEDYTTRVVKYKSKDGTEVPMYLTYKKGVAITGQNPVIVYDFGGYGYSAQPFYNYSNIAFFDNHGILAVLMLRGGGEMGKDWEEAGSGLHIQNQFDDFIAAAQYLVKEHYTDHAHLAIRGHGGPLIGAVIAQRPDLCRVAVSRVGLFDMLRFQKYTSGRYWTHYYGSPDDSTDFNNLLGYSPLHNLRPNTVYPSSLFITAENDDRVPPFQTYKFLATLQKNSTGGNPHILYFEDDAGHNGSDKYIDWRYEESFVLAFIFTEMDLTLNPF